MKLEIVKENKSISLNDIKKIESDFNISLPEDYVDFLITYNGGRTNEASFPNTNYIGNIRISEFFEIKRVVDFIEEIKKKPDEIAENSDWKYYWSDYAIKNIIIIADTYNQVLICLSCNKDSFGQIYYKDHDHGENFSLLANSFTDFIQGFDFLPEED